MMQFVERLLSMNSVNTREKDVYTFLKYGAIGFVGMGVYKVGTKMIKRDLDPSVEFEIPVESVQRDRVLTKAFLDLQEYKGVNEWLFRCAILNCDHLMFLEQVLMQGDVTPVRNDKVIAFSHFKLASTRLKMLQISVHEKIGAHHAALVGVLIKKIYSQMQIHFTNILHMCKDFKPENLLKEARKDIAAWESRASNALHRGKSESANSILT